MTNLSPVFTIIIPSFNDLELLKNSLYSIIQQKNVSFEIIIVDDSSTDDIENFIQRSNYLNLKYYRNIPALGAVKNWNYGLTLTKGEFIILLHHDEYFSERFHFLENCFEKIKLADCDALILNINVKFQNGSSKIQRIPLLLKKYITSFAPSLLYTVNIIGPTSCLIFKKSILVLFNEKLNWLVDVDWYFRILKHKKIVIENNLFINSIFGHKNQITTNIDTKKAEQRDQLIIKKSVNKLSSINFALTLKNILILIKEILNIKRKLFWKNQ